MANGLILRGIMAVVRRLSTADQYAVVDAIVRGMGSGDMSDDFDIRYLSCEAQEIAARYAGHPMTIDQEPQPPQPSPADVAQAQADGCLLGLAQDDVKTLAALLTRGVATDDPRDAPEHAILRLAVLLPEVGLTSTDLYELADAVQEDETAAEWGLEDEDETADDFTAEIRGA